MDFLKVKKVDEALEQIKEHFSGYEVRSEAVRLEESLGRISAENYYSGEDIPAFNRSTVDGYAVISRTTFGATESVPSLLNISSKIEMGEYVNFELKEGDAAYVPTGGMLPEHADSVVMIEHTECFDEYTLAVNKPIAPGAGVIHKGDDVKEGNLLIEKGRKITELDIGVLAAAGIYEIKVYMPLTVCCISTGDEIVDKQNQVQSGKIRDINGYVISGLLRKSGCIVTNRLIVKDDFKQIKSSLEENLKIADFVVMSGGSSVGDKDYTFDAINAIGKVFIHGLSVKPGKPTIVGNAKGKPIFGLPGHPVSAVLVYKLIVAPYIALLTGKSSDITVKAILTNNIHSSPGKLTMQTVRLLQSGSELFAEPVYGKSGLITMLSKSDGFIKIPENIEGLNKGQKVDVIIL